MPVIETEKIIKTKVLGVQEHQSELLDMYNHPEMVCEVYVKDNSVFVTMEYPNPLNNYQIELRKYKIGVIKDKYHNFVIGQRLTVKQWRITGGDKIDGYERLHQYFGLNITFNYQS